MDGSISEEIDRYTAEYEDSLVEEYISSAKLKLLIIGAFLVAGVFLALYSLGMGLRGLDFFSTIGMLIDHLKGVTYPLHSRAWFNDNILWNSNLPRLLFTILAGAGLAIAGTAMQSTMNNPLADPYTVGVSAGACLGLSLALLLGFSLNSGGLYGILSFAFVFAMIPLFAIAIFAPKTRSSPSTLILAGVAIAYLFNAIDTVLLVSTDTETLATIYIWHTGKLEGIHWANLPVTFFSIIAGSIVIAYLSRQLNLLALGDASATSLGVDPDNLRIICLVAIAFIVAAVVGNAGVIGFVGLVSPHIARMMIGSNNRFVIPAASVISITMMLVADIVCRTLSEAEAIPVGSMLALIGAPIFLYLIARRNSRVW